MLRGSLLGHPQPACVFQEGSRRFCAYCYTFDYSEEQVLKRLAHLLNYLPQATKIRKVRLVAPRKIMYCVKLDFYLRAPKKGALSALLCLCLVFKTEARIGPQSSRRKWKARPGLPARTWPRSFRGCGPPLTRQRTVERRL